MDQPSKRNATRPAARPDGAAADAQTPRDTDPTIDFPGAGRQAAERPAIAGYEVLDELGRGGMGVVYQARQLKPKRLVALKVLGPELAANPAARKRFLREARAMAAIEHVHVVTVYHVSAEEGVPYLAMELLRGETLQRRLERDGRLPWRDVARLGRQVALGLGAAHEAGLVHRDIKPGNLWLQEGEEGPAVKLLDFGLARVAAEQSQLSATGAVLGTPQYMSPEQARGAEVDPRSDLFSLGVVLYRMATGALPFRGKTLPAIIEALETQTPRPPRELNPELPQALAELLVRLLQKEPDRRPASARELAAALAAIERAGAPETPAPRRGRGCALVAAAVVATLVLSVVAGVAAYWLMPLVFREEPAPREEDQPVAQAPVEKPALPVPQVIPISVEAGGPQEFRRQVETGAVEGTIELNYDMFTVPDRLTIYYDGKQIKDTGLVSGKGTVNVHYGPGTSTVVEIAVNEGTGQGQPGTAWSLNGRIVPAGTPAANGAAGRQPQRVTISSPAGNGTYSLSFDGATTAVVPHNANVNGAARLQAALNALPTIGGVGGSVNVALVSQTATTAVYEVTFGGALAERAVPLMTSITSPGITVTITR